MCIINMMRLQKIPVKVFKVVVNARSMGLVTMQKHHSEFNVARLTWTIPVLLN